MSGDYCAEKCSECECPSTTTMVMGHEKARDIRIEQLDFGYIVKVGCQSFALPNLESMLKLLTQYLYFPKEVEDQWRKGTLKFS